MSRFVHRRRALRATVLALAPAIPCFVQTAFAQSGPVTALDEISVGATKTPERAIEALAGVSVIGSETLRQVQPGRISDLSYLMPSVWFQERGDRPESAINIRGLQDFGRVAVIVDGARQNFQVTGHNANGTFFLEPELLSSVEVVRGPVANVYGSGAIGGVASFRTKDVDDVLKPGERFGVLTHGLIGSNGGRGLGSIFGATRVGPNVDLFLGGTIRRQGTYVDGHGTTVPNSAFDVGTGIAKATFRPADGHQVKFSGTRMDYDFKTGQPGIYQESVYDTNVVNNIVNGRWTYSRPDDKWFDFDGNIYWTNTEQKQRKTQNGTPGSSGNPITGFVGDPRSFSVETAGFDVYNTSRLDSGPFRNAFTYGGDGFQDTVSNVDLTGSGAITTPNGRRTVSGGFFQWRLNYSNWLEVISALRGDSYRLETTGMSTSGDHLSPKATVGVTPIAGLTVYGTFAEGYRAPSVTETLVAGAHPPFAVGFPNLFTFLPNPALLPEVGQTKEIGLNLKYDNVFKAADKFRAKFNVFRNDIENYIELVNFGPPVTFTFCPAPIPGCPPVPTVTIPINSTSLAQYQNIASAVIEGIELEAHYDAGGWFAGVAGQRLRGRDNTGLPLATIPPDKITTTLGFRFYEEKLTMAVRWSAVAAKGANEIPDRNGDGIPDYLPTGAYNLVNLYLGYAPTPDVNLSLGIDNVLNQYYVPYLAGFTSAPGQPAGTVFPGPGVVFKGGVQLRFGAT